MDDFRSAGYNSSKDSKQMKEKHFDDESCVLEDQYRDAIYFLHPKTNRYEKLTTSVQVEIEEGIIII